MPRANRHCSVVTINGTGVLIEGRSGAGKTSVALGLIDTAKARGIAAALVSDDQSLIEVRENRLFASAPAAIAGQAEIRGYGLAPIATVTEGRVGLVARLVPDEGIERMPEPKTVTVLGVELPLVELPERHEQQSVRIVLAWLEANRPGPN
jgi:serine kinase of HPr protein (carbohydrate metabolism regulator)